MNKNKIIFLSHPINDNTPLYGGNKSIILKQTRSIKKGDSCNKMNWSFPNHIGTHVDAPSHFIEGGLSITDYEPKKWVFNRILLADVSKIKPDYIIKKADIDNINDCELFLIKTGFEKYRSEEIFWRNSPGLHPELADWLKEKCPSIRAVGIDTISISNLNHRALGRKAHKAFLDNNILLIEYMKFSSLERIPDLIIVMPLMIEKADAAPCTILGIYD